MTEYKKMIIILHNLNEVEKIEAKKELSALSAILFDADRRLLKHLDSVKRVFFNHCNAEYLIVYTSDEDICSGLTSIHSDSTFRVAFSKSEFIRIIKGGG